jgi:uncharacterized phage protein (TIGR01671 family)
MREIKFRAWDKYFKKIVEVRSIGFKLKTIKVIPVKSINKLDIYETTLDDIELMQYTGLKDKNGVEIYEGDIIEQHEELYTVAWNDKMCCFVGYMEDMDYEMFSYVLRQKYIKVVGNIYENKELLNVKNS